MHLSRISEFGPPGMLTPLSADLLAAHGMQPDDFTPLAFSKAHFDGQLLAIPLDTHPFVQYYNTKLCRKAGLLDSSGQLPPIRGAQAMLAVLRKLKRLGVTPAVCDQVDDPATAWRLFYTLYSQAGGQVLADHGRRVVLDEALATRVLTREGLLLRRHPGRHHDPAAGANRPAVPRVPGWPPVNTYWALVLPQVPAPIAVFIFKKFFDGVPISLEQAAEVDGAGWWTSYRRIALPLARPAIAAVSIFTFVWTWNNFLWPFLAATSQMMMTIPAGIGTVVSGVGIVNALQMASAVLGALPLVFVFLLAQRQIVEGVAGTGLK